MKGILKHDLYSGIYCLITKILTFGLIFFVAGIMAINRQKYMELKICLCWKISHMFFMGASRL